jgi:hypothetical protein
MSTARIDAHIDRVANGDDDSDDFDDSDEADTSDSSGCGASSFE